jgi:hypothetical protein
LPNHAARQWEDLYLSRQLHLWRSGGRSLREADELSTQCGELLTAVGEHIAICDGIIADCKDSVERIERILGHLATKSLRC